MLKLKLFAVIAFLAFAACAFLFSGGQTQAQTGENAAKRDDILEKVADYKNWKQVQKPEKKFDSAEAATDVLALNSSTVGG